MIKQQMKSRTMRLMLLLEALGAGTAAMNYMKPFLTPEQYALVMTALTVITPVLAMYMRQITTTSIAEK